MCCLSTNKYSNRSPSGLLQPLPTPKKIWEDVVIYYITCLPTSHGLFTLSGTMLKRSTAYHPQTYGQSEVVNRVLEQYFHSFVANQPQQWSRILHCAKYCYNTLFHSTARITLFQVVFGKEPPLILDYVQSSANVNLTDHLLYIRQKLLLQLKQHLTKAQKAMKRSADLK